jgi:hypothetical protein
MSHGEYSSSLLKLRPKPARVTVLVAVRHCNCLGSKQQNRIRQLPQVLESKVLAIFRTAKNIAADDVNADGKRLRKRDNGCVRNRQASDRKGEPPSSNRGGVLKEVSGSVPDCDAAQLNSSRRRSAEHASRCRGADRLLSYAMGRKIAGPPLRSVRGGPGYPGRSGPRQCWAGFARSRLTELM